MTANNSAYQTASEITESIKAFADDVRATTPLVHCITNYVTVESCANAVLAVGASPIMSDEPAASSALKPAQWPSTQRPSWGSNGT